MTLDEFLASVRADKVPPNTFVTDGSGYWSNGLPCPHCGSISVVLDPVPTCVTCTARKERLDVNVEWLQRSLDGLLADVRQMTEQERQTVIVAALIANVQLQKLLAELR